MEKELATSPPRRRVHSEVLRANEHRIEVLRQELGEERHTEETARSAMATGGDRETDNGSSCDTKPMLSHAIKICLLLLRVQDLQCDNC